MKKIIAILLAAVLCFALAACGGNGTEETTTADETTNAAATLKDVKMGLICLHDENSTYDSNFIQAAKKASEELGFELVIKVNIPEDDTCGQAAEELAEEGCDVIFADSFGHETYIMAAAEEYPEVEFCHATGTYAHTSDIKNFHNAFASIYEGRYLAGIAAGMKINEMIEDGKFKAEDAKMGYVGAYPYAEVISGYTSFYLGAKSVCPSVTMDVKYTNSWFDIALEKEAAEALISSGCILISQHADSEGAPKACEDKGVPNVAYNINTKNLGPTTALISSKIDWTPYFKLITTAIANGEAIPDDYCGTLETGSVVLTELNTDVAAKGTQEAIDKAAEDLKAGKIKVFDTANFTVKDASTVKTNEANFISADNYKTDADGHLTSYKADVETDKDFTPDTEVVADGVFAESSFRSAPYFNVNIDGINA